MDSGLGLSEVEPIQLRSGFDPERSRGIEDLRKAKQRASLRVSPPGWKKNYHPALDGVGLHFLIGNHTRHANVVWFLMGQVINDLEIKGKPKGRDVRRNLTQKTVVAALASSQPMMGSIKGHPGHNNEIDLVHTHRPALSDLGLFNPIRPDPKILAEISNQCWTNSFLGSVSDNSR